MNSIAITSPECNLCNLDQTGTRCIRNPMHLYAFGRLKYQTGTMEMTSHGDLVKARRSHQRATKRCHPRTSRWWCLGQLGSQRFDESTCFILFSSGCMNLFVLSPSIPLSIPCLLFFFTFPREKTKLIGTHLHRITGSAAEEWAASHLSNK